MPLITDTSANFNPMLTQTATEFMHDDSEFVADVIAPKVSVVEQSSTFHRWDKANELDTPSDEQLRRAPGSAYRRIRSSISGDSYATKERGGEHPVDHRERAKYANVMNYDQRAIARLVGIERRRHEQVIYDMVKGSSVPNSEPGAGTKWDEGNVTEDQNPVAQVDALKEAIHDAVGMEPTHITFNRDVLNVLKHHPYFVDKMKYTDFATPNAVIAALSGYFGLQVVVSGIVKNTANEGQAVVTQKIWSDEVLVWKRTDNPTMEDLNFAVTPMWTANGGNGSGVVVETYEENQTRATIHRFRVDCDEKPIVYDAAWRLDNVLLNT